MLHSSSRRLEKLRNETYTKRANNGMSMSTKMSLIVVHSLSIVHDDGKTLLLCYQYECMKLNYLMLMTSDVLTSGWRIMRGSNNRQDICCHVMQSPHSFISFFVEWNLLGQVLISML
ncbi:hypothetical protein KP509_07G073200 [Ceratopteris richardii]|uniref:Uncharacterized protein n=1 Tax=Ceratopteris richardii TaxID=49495 RepID=A0A8T2UG91_CERRI|nr:hypothetical protein KP509_07G073200 [Ceratopteris richardii]